MFKKITLKNGLRIIIVPQENAQAITSLVLVKTGSKYERKEIMGISHFLEHLFFKGTKKRPSSLAVAETLDKLGGNYNAFTSEECTGYYAKVAAPYFETALDWVADIYLNSLLPSKEIEKERGVITEEINMRFDNPMIYVWDLWKNLLYGDQPAGWFISGTKDTVNKITREQFLRYMNSHYVASNTIVCLAGKISLSQGVNKVKKYFSEIRTNEPGLKTSVIDASVKDFSFSGKNQKNEKQKKPELLVFPKKTDQTNLILGVRTFNIYHPQRFTLEIIATILGGMMSSRLFIELREKLGLTYYIKTEAESDPDVGYLATSIGTDNQKVEKAISVILKEYKKLSQKEITPLELKKAKDNFKGRLALSLESSDAKAFFYAGQEILENEILTPEQIFKKIDKISQNDILDVAKEIFKPERLNLSLIGPFKNRDKFKNLLKF